MKQSFVSIQCKTAWAQSGSGKSLFCLIAVLKDRKPFGWLLHTRSLFFLPCIKERLLLAWGVTQSQSFFCLASRNDYCWHGEQSMVFFCLASRSDYCWHGEWHKVTVFFCLASRSDYCWHGGWHKVTVFFPAMHVLQWRSDYDRWHGGLVSLLGDPVKYRWVCLPMFPKSTRAE